MAHHRMTLPFFSLNSKRLNIFHLHRHQICIHRHYGHSKWYSNIFFFFLPEFFPSHMGTLICISITKHFNELMKWAPEQHFLRLKFCHGIVRQLKCYPKNDNFHQEIDFWNRNLATFATMQLKFCHGIVRQLKSYPKMPFFVRQ